MGTEDWILQGTKLMTNTQNQRLKIQCRGQTFKNTILKRKKKQSHKNYEIYVYEVCFKNRVLFYKVIVGYKMELKGVIEGLKIKKIKN